jgi:4-coumarate--CoA ligase
MQTIVARWPDINIFGGQFPKERWIGFLPLYHAYGQLYANLMATKLETPIFIMKQFNYAEFLQHIQNHKIDYLQVAPPILVMLVKRPETKQYDLSSLKGILCGAAPLSKELALQVTKQFGCYVKQGWGMTEVTCGSILELEPSQSGTIGKLISNTECKLVDDDGKEVGYDTPGELCIRAPNVMLGMSIMVKRRFSILIEYAGYFKNEAATRDSLSNDGWLKTGDVAVTNKEGLYWIVDRKKEVRAISSPMIRNRH